MGGALWRIALAAPDAVAAEAAARGVRCTRSAR